MPAFLKDISLFYGTQETNEEGKDLETFLEEYDNKCFENPSVTADILVFRYQSVIQSINNGLKLLMIRRKNHPGIGCFALPGGFVNMRENADDAAKRELREETGLTDISVEQMYCWADYDRDPRTRIVTLSYMALIEEERISDTQYQDNLSGKDNSSTAKKQTIQAGDDAADALWMGVSLRKEEAVNRADRRITPYVLELSNNNREIHLTARVEYSENIEGLLKEPHYKVIYADQIAFDHPCFIVQALKVLEARITKKY